MYRGYRKASHALHVWIVILAILCILATITLFVLLQNISIDENNIKVLRIPFTDHVIPLEGTSPVEPTPEATPEPEPEPEPKPVVSEPNALPEERIETSVLLPASLLFDEAHLSELLEELKGSKINTLVLEVKPASGKLAFLGSDPLAKTASTDSSEPLTKLRERLIGAGYQVVASVSCFRDNLIPRDDPDLACKNQDETLWGDAKRYTWLNPYSAEARSYLAHVVSDLYALGFHEIRLTDLSFPVAEDANLIAYESGKDTSASKQAELETFLGELGKSIGESSDLTLSVVYTGAEGQSAQAFTNFFYRIYLPVAPVQNGHSIDGTPIREFSSMLGEGNLPYRLVPIISLKDRSAQDAYDLAFSVSTFGTGYHLEDSSGTYDEILFPKAE